MTTDGEQAERPEAMLLDGPPAGGDLLLHRALRRIRAEAARIGRGDLPPCPLHRRPRDL